MGLSSLANATASVLLALVSTAATARAAGPVCSPLAYGAVGDGVTDNTVAIQSAIDGCEATYGGGVVRISAEPGKSTYLTGPIRLANHIRLQLDKGVTLRATTDHSKYRTASIKSPFHANEALISAYKAIDTGIIGPGTIDGQGGIPTPDGGSSWWKLSRVPDASMPSPWLIEFYQCTGVTVNDVTLTNAPMWNLVLRYSRYITVSELSVTVTPVPLIADTDGIDVVGSSDATLIFLNINSGGDSIALKSGLPPGPNEPGLPQQPTHDIQIVNSRFSNGNGIVVGEAANGVYNVMATNITATNTTHGLQIKADRTAANQATGDYNILMQNMTLMDVKQPLAIGADDRSGEDRSDPHAAVMSNIHDITVSGMTATNSGSAGFIAGLPESCIRNVTLSNVNIATSGTGLELRNMTGTLTNVTISSSGPPFVVQRNVHVMAAGGTPAITNSPPDSVTQPRELPCGGNPEN